MKILFASLGAYGHLYPLMPLALAAAEAGHEVRVATGAPFLDRLPLPTVPAYTGLELGDAVAETRRRHPQLSGVDLSVAMFADVTSEQVLPTMVEVCENFGPDLVVYEAMITGAGVAADVLGIPAAAYAIGLARFVYPMLHGETIRYRSDAWHRSGRTPPRSPLLATALIDPAPPSLRSFGGAIEIDTIPVRPVAYSESSASVPEWLRAPGERPRVFLTLGTVSFGAVEVLRRAAEEIAAQEADLLVAVGPDGDPAVVDGIGGSVRVERFVAQSEVLPLVDLFVHHGGTGSVLGALEAGLPQVILPQGADQFANADVLSQLGAARALPEDEQTPGAIGAAVSDLLRPCPERDVATMIAGEIAALPAPAEVLPRLVDLARKG